MNKNKVEGHTAILLANIFWGLNIPFSKMLLTHWMTPIGYMAARTTFFLLPFGMKYIRATTVSTYMNLQPIVASVAAIFVGQDSFTWDKPVATTLVMAGAYIVTTSPAKAIDNCPYNHLNDNVIC